jgi:hypothetical protein
MLERRKAERRRPLPISDNDNDFAGQFCRLPDGQRVFVASVGIAPGCRPTAVYEYIEGPQQGNSGACPPSSLALLGKVIPVQEANRRIPTL